MSRVALFLEPLDVVFFGAGRSLTGGRITRSGDPSPQVVRGALTSHALRAAGCDLERLGRCLRGGATFEEATRDGQPEAVAMVAALRFRGPWLARRTAAADKAVEPLLPAPTTLCLGPSSSDTESRLVRRDPLAREMVLPGWPHADRRPLAPRGGSIEGPFHGLLTSRGLSAFLEGRTPDAHPEAAEVVRLGDVMAEEPRVGIGIDAATQSVAEERIYQAGFLRLRPGIGYCVEVDVPEGGAALIPLPGATVALGGEARRASVGVVDRPRWPTVPSGPDRRVSVLLTTPALLPLRLGAGHVVAALEGPREPYSGWDLARGGPKPTRFAAPAGSVYFLEGGDPPSDSVCDEEHARAGWGGVVLGRWAHAGG